MMRYKVEAQMPHEAVSWIRVCMSGERLHIIEHISKDVVNCSYCTIMEIAVASYYLI